MPPLSRSRSRGRSMMRTPQSNKKRRYEKSSSRSTSSGGLGMLLDAAEVGASYAAGGPVGGAVTALEKAVKYTQTKNRSRSRVGFSGTSYLGGKLKKGRRTNKKVKRKGKYTAFGVAKKGITLATESRKTISGQEAILVGHTSLPAKRTAMNMWRALMKHLFLKMQVTIKDYGELVLNYGFAIDDKITFWYHENQENDLALNRVDKLIIQTDTFDSVANHFYGHFAGIPDNYDDRLVQLTYYPAAGNIQKQQVTINLNTLKIAVTTKSTLKLQNVTVDTTANNESDDVTRVPLQGKLFHCKGNNLMRKVGNKILPGLYHTEDESAIFEAQTAASATFFNSNGYYNGPGGGLSNNQTTFYKTSEMPKPHEIMNCQRSSKFYMGSGAIKSSVLSNTFEMTLPAFWKLIYTFASGLTNFIQYSEKLGKCNTIFLEKVIGKTPTDQNAVTLWTELEFRQSVLIFGHDSTFTAPITYQANY